MWNVSTANERRDMDASQIPQDILDVMHNPGVYYCDMPGMGEAQTAQLEILYDFNATRPREASRRRELLERFFAEVGGGTVHRAAAARQLGVQHPLGRALLCEFQPHLGG